MINDFEVHALTSMFTGLMISFYRLGGERALQSWICGMTGWNHCAVGGSVLQMVTIVTLPKFYDWVQAGDDSVPEELRDVTEATKSEKGRSNFDVHDVL